jgi:DNA-binding MarR family transcriptional regulator
MERERVEALEITKTGKTAIAAAGAHVVARVGCETAPILREHARAVYDASGYDLSSHPAHMIRRAHQRATFYFQQVMNGLDLTPTQQAALAMLLKHGELSQNHLGRLTAMDPSTISIVVQKLRKSGLIHRRGSKKDQRLAMIRLTDRGAHFAIARLADSMEVARRVLAPLSRSEQKILVDLLHKIGDGDDDFA